MNIAWLIAIVIIGIAILTFVSLMSRRTSGLDNHYYRSRWEAIQEYLAKQETLNLAVLEADKLLDKALKDSKYKGSTMGERMVSAKKIFSKRDQVWMAHKLRNRIVHEQGVEASRKQAKASLAAVRRALKDLGAL